jgi:3-polyprenyl-4-hydroxybenzoate decarboxylase
MAPATRHRYYRKEPNPPRRSIFLASAPMTEEETTLLRFAQQHPEQAREVLSPPSSGPIHIDPVVIAPVQIAALSASQPDAH